MLAAPRDLWRAGCFQHVLCASAGHLQTAALGLSLFQLFSSGATFNSSSSSSSWSFWTVFCSIQKQDPLKQTSTSLACEVVIVGVDCALKTPGSERILRLQGRCRLWL